MERVRCGSAAALCIVLAHVMLGAQQARPNLSGVWLMIDPASAESNLGGVFGGGPKLVIEQTPTTIKIDRQYGRAREFDANRWTFTVTLDGAETTHVGAPAIIRPGMERVIASKASWDGPVLVITTTSTVTEAGKVRSRIIVIERARLDGQALRVDRTGNQIGSPVSETYTRAR